MTPRAYLLDLDGTLYHPRLVKLGMALELTILGAHRIHWLRQFRKQHEALRAELALSNAPFEPNPFDEQIRRSAVKLGVEPTQLTAVVFDWMFERPGKWIRLAKNQALLNEVSAFRQSGGRTAVVSDYPAQAKLKALGCADLFEVVVASGEYPGLTRLKPSPDGYLAAARALEVSPEDCLVIGDRDDADGLAAKRAGMHFRLV